MVLFFLFFDYRATSNPPIRAPLQRHQNRLHHIVALTHHLTIGETQRNKSCPLANGRITPQIALPIMGFPIDLDDHAFRRAEEIGDPAANYRLPTKLMPIQAAVAQC